MNLAVWQFLMMPVSRGGWLLVQLLNGQEEGHFKASVKFGQYIKWELSWKTIYKTASKANKCVKEEPPSNKREKSV